MNVSPRNVTVVGAGQMGSGIAQVSAQAGFDVALVDVSDAALSAGLAGIDNSLARLVRSERLDVEGARIARRRITGTTLLKDAAQRSILIVEAVPEALDLKQDLFARLDAWCEPDVVLASNTSQFQISKIAEKCVRPDRVIGMHWSNPPPLMRLVEVILGAQTSQTALKITTEFLVACEREFVICQKDVPGFISNRLSTALFMEAARLVDEGVATAEDVDAVARLMYGHAMGPIATLDLAGLDTALKVSTALSEHYGGDRFTPPPILARLVEQGRYGRKSGSGFYDEQVVVAEG